MALEDNSTLLNELPLKLRNKAIRWKPSELEITLLKIHFQNNEHPTTKEKELLIKNFAFTFNSQVNIVQLTRWFKNERERTFKKREKELTKTIYKKFKQEELDYLNQSFTENRYPRVDIMTTMANQMDCTLSKIENWYKHNRRMRAKEGSMILKNKKYFKNAELAFLLDTFNQNSFPNSKQMIDIAENLNCDKYQIKNWYSNRRKKFKQLRKTELKHSEAQPFQANNMIDPASLEPYQSSPDLVEDLSFIPSSLNTQNFSVKQQNQIPWDFSSHEAQYLRPTNTYSHVPQNIYNTTNLPTRSVQVADFSPRLNMLNAPTIFANQSYYHNIPNQNSSYFCPQNNSFSFPIQMASNPRWIDPAMSSYGAVTNVICDQAFDDMGQPNKRLVMARPPVAYVLFINPNQY